jgi:hypothetical protein
MIAIMLAAICPLRLRAQERVATGKESPPRILAHYMSWFEAKPFRPQWGWHWTMNAFDPGKLEGGRPSLASHYHPLVGPYDSADPNLLEYHVLLMRLAGIDGVIINWYGREDLFDYKAIDRNAAALLDWCSRVRLQFAICYEDQVIPRLVTAGRVAESDRVPHARAEITWLGEHWFGLPEYLREGGRPVLLSFGENSLTDPEWKDVFQILANPPLYLSEHRRREAASGAFDWPVPQAGVKAQDTFYDQAPEWPVAMPVAFPRFHDIYEQANVHASYGRIDDDGGRLFATLLERALRSGSPLVQICTWNDWGEGTVIEPSLEFGYRDLEVIQRLRKSLVEPGFTGTSDDLRLPRRLLELRRSRGHRPEATAELDCISASLASRETRDAKRRLDGLEGPVVPAIPCRSSSSDE